MCNSWPFGYAPFLRCPAGPLVPGLLAAIPVYQSEAVRNYQKLLFFAVASAFGKGLSQEPQQKATGTCFPGVAFFPFDGFSGEVKHVVHLIRWNLKSRYMPLWLT